MSPVSASSITTINKAIFTRAVDCESYQKFLLEFMIRNVFAALHKMTAHAANRRMFAMKGRLKVDLTAFKFSVGWY